MSDQSLTTAELCEWLANPQWTNGRLNQEDAVVYMMLAADTIATKDARITELKAELSTVRGENEALKKAVKEEAEGHTHACHDMHEANAELAAAKVRIGELEGRQDFLLRAAIDATWGEALEDGSVPATKLQDRVIAFVLRHASPRETMCELIARAERAESAFSLAIDERDEAQESEHYMREALDGLLTIPGDSVREAVMSIRQRLERQRLETPDDEIKVSVTALRAELSASIEQGKILVNEVRVLREALGERPTKEQHSNVLRSYERLRQENEELREALEKIAWECDPKDPEWNQPEEGRNYIWKEARAALAQVIAPPAPPPQSQP